MTERKYVGRPAAAVDGLDKIMGRAKSMIPASSQARQSCRWWWWGVVPTHPASLVGAFQEVETGALTLRVGLMSVTVK